MESLIIPIYCILPTIPRSKLREAVLAFHGGHALAELGSWLLAADGADSLGPWSIVVIFAPALGIRGLVGNEGI